jgi:hypothetical protein
MEYSAFEWDAKRMPYFGKQPNKKSLSSNQAAFIQEFVVNGPAVMSRVEFTIYGKGLD